MDAYKQWPASVTDQWAALLLTLDGTGKPVALVNKALNFGAVGSVWGHCWLSCALSIAISWSMGLAVLAYVDDFATISPCPTSLQAVLDLHTALHLPVHLKPGKIHHPAAGEECSLLGVVITITPKAVLAANEPTRVAKLRTLCTTAAKQASIPLVQWHQLLGKLSFACAQSWGRTARAALRVLYRAGTKNPVIPTPILRVWLL